MNRWQYAWLTDQPQASIGFSHPQQGLAAELAGLLGPGVYVQASNEWSISLDRSRVNLGYLSGLMGDRGWEMFSVETRLQPAAVMPNQMQTNWYFRRPVGELSAASVMASAATSSPADAPRSADAQPLPPAAADGAHARARTRAGPADANDARPARGSVAIQRRPASLSRAADAVRFVVNAQGNG